MELAKFSIVLLILIGRVWAIKIKIKTTTPDGFAGLEEAAINILTNCYANQDKTIVLSGNVPESFGDKLSSRGLFSLALLDNRERPMNNTDYWTGRHRNTQHKVHIAVMLASSDWEYGDVLQSIMNSRYYNTMAHVLIIGWSSEKRYAACEDGIETSYLLFYPNLNDILKVNLLCDHQDMGTVLFTSNPSGNRAPKPWRLVGNAKFSERPFFHWFVRKYNENGDICENLDFDKTRDLHGLNIKTIRYCRKTFCSHDTYKNRPKSRRATIVEKKRASYIVDFIAYVNATGVDVFRELVVGDTYPGDGRSIVTRPSPLRFSGRRTCTYPHGVVCMYLVTKFRGNKTQLQKILTVIDGYSWIGVGVVCFVTLMFFKYLLHQTLMDGILNIIRLSCDMGLIREPRNLAQRIYMACVLFFVVTMQGIFVSNLAALLTQDMPVRQVESIQDLADLGYTIYAPKTFFILFRDVLPKNRMVHLQANDRCIEYILRHPLVACLKSVAWIIEEALDYNLHISDCVRMEYVINTIPQYWAFEEKLNKFLGIVIASGTMMPLHYLVDEKRLLEADSEKVPPEPRVITLNDLAFAFVILGTGLTCALVTFAIEIMIHRYHRRVRRTRVVFLN